MACSSDSIQPGQSCWDGPPKNFAFLHFVHPDDQAATLTIIDQPKTRVDAISFGNRHRCKDGSWKSLRWTASPLPAQRKIYATARDVPLDKGGRIEVKPDCSQPGHPEVFAIGDIVSLTDANKVKVPGVSPAAIQMGKYVAKTIKEEAESVKRSERFPFVYLNKGNMATIGRSAAIAHLGPIKVSGFIAWVLWLGVHLIFLIGFRDKIAVLVQWFYSYVRYKRGARIITGLPPD